MKNYPAGLWAKSKCFRVLKSVFTKECQTFILERMKASHKNIKPVVVINDTTKECKCLIPDDNLTGFIDDNSLNSKLLCLQIKQTANYQIEKTKIQNSSKSAKQKEKDIEKL
tara:strand:- start:228 stop:563 length:336 start_codon:yes stop_codon:yes gene_type:complete